MLMLIPHLSDFFSGGDRAPATAFSTQTFLGSFNQTMAAMTSSTVLTQPYAGHPIDFQSTRTGHFVHGRSTASIPILTGLSCFASE